MMNKVIGIDIGGTSIKLALFDMTGLMLDQWSIPTNTANEGSGIPADIIQSIRERMSQGTQCLEEILGIGIGVPGPVNEEVVKRAVNLGWTNFPLKQMIEKSLNIPVALLNDANAAALGEMWKGSTEHVRNLVFVTIGTGVGGGIIVDGKILNGEHASGGEIGHIPVHSTEERICGCGNINCLECYGSANGMVKTMNRLADRSAVSNTKEIFDLIEADDPQAKEALKITVDYLGRAIAGVMNTLDPEEIVIGGGVSEAGPLFLTPLRAAIDSYAFPQISGSFRLRKAILGNEAGMYGAAYQIVSTLKEYAV
ncbi:ROK family protein [Enterococcus sp. AZ196]|uniref:ROK family protein n=1 Tax=Enterococcus sp. AZ196 TaxID=2774659 RepID=UPI003D2B6A56